MSKGFGESVKHIRRRPLQSVGRAGVELGKWPAGETVSALRSTRLPGLRPKPSTLVARHHRHGMSGRKRCGRVPERPPAISAGLKACRRASPSAHRLFRCRARGCVHCSLIKLLTHTSCAVLQDDRKQGRPQPYGCFRSSGSDWSPELNSTYLHAFPTRLHLSRTQVRRQKTRSPLPPPPPMLMGKLHPTAPSTVATQRPR